MRASGGTATGATLQSVLIGPLPGAKNPGKVAVSVSTVLRLFQFTDSAFPTGGYAFSHGLEGLVAGGDVRTEADVLAVVQVHIEEGLTRVELPALYLAHRAARSERIEALMELDGTMDALKPVPAFREGSTKVGCRFLTSAAPLVSSSVVREYQARIGAGESGGHYAVAFGVVLAAAAVEESHAALAFGSGFVSNLTSAAVRLGLIGQVAAQRIITATLPAVESAAYYARDIGPDEMGGYTPGFDVAGLRQPTLTARLFSS